MAQTEGREEVLAAPAGRDYGAVAPAPASQPAQMPDGTAPCPTCGPASAATPVSYVYAIGRIEPRFPRLSVEKELAQATGRAGTNGLTDRQALHKVLVEPRNRYLVRQLCWVVMIGGLETYILVPRDPSDLDLLVEALRPEPQPWDLDVVVGIRGPIASPEMCNGLLVPIMRFDQIYSFDRETLIKGIPRPEKVSAREFTATAGELFDRVVQMTDNAGATDEHRAVNYLAVRYSAIYATTATAHARNASLSAVEIRPSQVSGVRRVVEVIFSYSNRNTDVMEKFFVRVDVTEEFPFLVTKMSPYVDR
jgi:PatG C-terminal